jgi:hypothetical protein
MTVTFIIICNLTKFYGEIILVCCAFCFSSLSSPRFLSTVRLDFRGVLSPARFCLVVVVSLVFQSASRNHFIFRRSGFWTKSTPRIPFWVLLICFPAGRTFVQILQLLFSLEILMPPHSFSICVLFSCLPLVEPASLVFAPGVSNRSRLLFSRIPRCSDPGFDFSSSSIFSARRS